MDLGVGLAWIVRMGMVYAEEARCGRGLRHRAQLPSRKGPAVRTAGLDCNC